MSDTTPVIAVCKTDLVLPDYLVSCSLFPVKPYTLPIVCLCICFRLCSAGLMFSNRWRFGWDRYTEVDLFTDHNDTNAETLSQAIRAASEEPDADGSVLFGHLQGTVVGLRYYTGVVRIKPGHLYSSNAVISLKVTLYTAAKKRLETPVHLCILKLLVLLNVN